MTEKMSDFKDILRSHNLRPTQQRVNLGKLLFGKGRSACNCGNS